MAKQTLPTNYKDDVLATSMGKKRRYNLIQNDDGTISLEDATEYTQVGDNYGAAQLNATNQAVNESVDQAKIIDSLDDISANTQPGMVAGALAVAELNSKIDYTFEQANPSTYPILNGYQLSRVGRLVTFSVTDYKKVTGRIEGRKVGQIPSEIAPPIALAVPLSTTGAVTNTQSNPGSRLIIGTDGVVSIYCNYDTGNYASWSCTWVI